MSDMQLTNTPWDPSLLNSCTQANLAFEAEGRDTCQRTRLRPVLAAADRFPFVAPPFFFPGVARP